MFVQSMGVHYNEESKRSVCEPGNLIGTRPNLSAKKVDPPAT